MKTRFQHLKNLFIPFFAFSTFSFAGNPANILSVKATANAASCVSISDTITNLKGSLDWGKDGDGDRERVRVLADKKRGKSLGGIYDKNIIYTGAGFVSLIGIISTVFSSAGYTSTHIPTITLAYEHGVSKHWAIGVLFDYSSTSWSLENQPGDTSYSGGKFYDYSNSATFTGMAAALTTTYHFITSNEKIDPYIGAAVGYTSIKFDWTTTDKFSPDDGNIPLKILASGVLFGGYVGARFYVSDHLGFWTNIGYLGASGAVLNIGLALKF